MRDNPGNNSILFSNLACGLPLSLLGHIIIPSFARDDRGARRVMPNYARTNSLYYILTFELLTISVFGPISDSIKFKSIEIYLYMIIQPGFKLNGFCKRLGYA